MINGILVASLTSVLTVKSKQRITVRNVMCIFALNYAMMQFMD